MLPFQLNPLVGQETFNGTLSPWKFQAEMGSNVSAERQLPFTSVTPLALPKLGIKLKREDKSSHFCSPLKQSPRTTYTRAPHNSEGKLYFYMVERRATIVSKNDGQPYLYTIEKSQRKKLLKFEYKHSHRRSFNSLKDGGVQEHQL